MKKTMRPAIPPAYAPSSCQDAMRAATGQAGISNATPPVVERISEVCSETCEMSPWGAIIQTLVGEISQRNPLNDAPKNQRAHKRASRKDGQESFFRTVYVDVLERVSTSSAGVSWRDPTDCSYGSHMWHRAISRRSGICALSGSEIRRGDSVYQPRTRPRAANASAMILSTHIESPRAP
jgi:hypothetical protein